MAFRNIPPNGFPALPDVEDLEVVVKDVTALKTSVLGLTEDVTDLNDNKANQITIASFFNAESSYDVGDLVYYNGLTYRCTNSHEGEWDADDFAGTTIANELDSLRSGLITYAKHVTHSFGSGDTDIDISSLGLGSGIISCANWQHYSIYTYYREADNLFLHKVNSDDTTITIAVKDATTITITSNAAAGGTCSVIS